MITVPASKSIQSAFQQLESPVSDEIKSEKILVKEIFSNMWFCIPNYQRPYIWSSDEINDLLDDLTFAHHEKPKHEYFLGSFVFQNRKAEGEFEENDLLDGQQRMTTMLMLFACIRDLSDNDKAKRACQKAIFQEGDEFANVPERTRITFAIRETVQHFINEFISADGGTNREKELKSLAKKSPATSVKNMANAVLKIRGFFNDPENDIKPDALLKFLLNQVLLIYVSTEDLDDAFRLFMIMNDRGVPLRNSDILKSTNLGALATVKEKEKFSKMWEEAENLLGDEFDRFLNYLRAILVKEKARLNLLQEYEDKIYAPKEKDKATGKKKPALLAKGKETFEFIERHLENYNALLKTKNYDETGNSFRFFNLLHVMLNGLPSTDWIPPLLAFYDRFKYEQIVAFLAKLDNKFSADWIGGETPTVRIAHMNQVISVVEQATDVEAILKDDCFQIDDIAFSRVVQNAVYGRRFTRYLLLKLDYYYHDHSHPMSFETLSIEHVLPQQPKKDSQWCKDFTTEQLEKWTDRLGNLVIITRRKNSSQGRLDYAEKKAKYFSKNITSCANSLRVLQGNDTWTLNELEANHKEVTEKIFSNYGIV